MKCEGLRRRLTIAYGRATASSSIGWGRRPVEGTGQIVLRGLNANSLSRAAPVWAQRPCLSEQLAGLTRLSQRSFLKSPSPRSVLGGSPPVEQIFWRSLRIVWEGRCPGRREEDGVFILVPVCLGIGEGGMEEGWLSSPLRVQPVCHMAISPSPDVQGGLCLLGRGRAGLRVLWNSSRRSEGKIQHSTGSPSSLGPAKSL